jgi:hypothetical protein
MRIASSACVVVMAVAGQARAEPAPRAYVELGAAIGAGYHDGGYSYVELQVDGGYRLSRSWWLHARLGYGRFGTILPLNDTYLYEALEEARVGVEARTCAWLDRICFVGGLDVGVRRDDSPPAQSSFLFGIVVLRLGLDVGWPHVRIRPTLEVELGSQPDFPLFRGGAATLGVAYTW